MSISAIAVMITGIENFTRVPARDSLSLLVKTKSLLGFGIYLGIYTLKIYAAATTDSE